MSIESTKSAPSDEAQIQELLNHSSEMLSLFDTDFRCLVVNDAYCRIFNQPHEFFLNRTVSEIFSHDLEHYEMVIEPRLKGCLEGKTSNYKSWLEVPEIGKTYFDIEYIPVFDDSGNVVRIAVVGRDRTELMKQLEALQESQAMLKRTEQIANLGGSFIDFENQSVTWTEQVYAMHEVGSDYVPDINTLFNDFFSEDQMPALREWQERTLVEEGPQEITVQMTTAKGNKRWIRSIAFPVREDDKVTGIHAIIQDISENYELQHQLQQSEEKFRSLVEEVNAVVWEVSLNPLRYTYLSPQVSKMTGYPMEECFKEHFMERIMHPDDLQTCQNKIYANLAAGENFSLEYRIIKANGEIMWIHDNSRPFKDAEGNIIGTRGVFVDITETKEMQKGLDEASRAIQNYQHVLDQHAIVSMADAEGRYTYVNEKFVEITGYSKEELLGKTIEAILPAFYKPEFYENLANTLNSLQVWQGEICQEKKNGELFWTNTTILPVANSKGEIESNITIRSDITELKRTEQALRNTQKMEVIGQLTGGVAHDFNNLLNIIIGNLELMEMDPVAEQKVGDLIKNIKSAANRGAVLTRRLLNYSHKAPVDSEILDLNICLSNLKELISKSLTAMVQVEMDLEENAWLIEVDQGDLEDSIINLSINASDAMPAGGKLIFRTRNYVLHDTEFRGNEKLQPGQYVELSIEDSGSGIDQELLDKIFDPYFSTKPSDKGSGLGLAMVFGFVKRSHGQIFVQSSPGSGSLFQIYFPKSAKTPGNETSVVEKTKESSDANHQEVILLVDDEKEILEITRLNLERMGYSVLSCSNGEEAKEVIESDQDIDLLLTDVVMPGSLDGYQLAREAVQLRPDIKLLFTTGYSKVVPDFNLFEWNDITLQKPYKRAELSKKVREILDR